jgi:hypothetical protein
LRDFLTRALQDDPDLGSLFGAAGAMNVSLNTPQEMSEGTDFGVSLWLYRLERDELRLNAAETYVAPDQLRGPPLPLRLHYLVTPMTDVTTAVGTETAQFILGKVLQVLHDQPLLRGADLADDFVGSDVELAVRLEPLGLQEIYQIWDALELPYRLSVSYEVSVVNIERATEPAQVSPVLIAETGYGVIVDVE